MAKPVAYLIRHLTSSGQPFSQALRYHPEPESSTTICTPLYAAPAVPDGWKLVPVEPTEAMKVAAFGPIIEGGRGGPITKDFLRQEIGIRTFKAMIAAAPSFGTDYPGGALSTEQSTLHPLADRGKSATTSQPLVRGEGEP